MTEEDKTERRERRFAEAVAEIAHSQMGYLIGFGFMAFAISVGSSWDGHLYDRKDCVKIQETEDATYKVDSCSGDVEVLKQKEKYIGGISSLSDENDKHLTNSSSGTQNSMRPLTRRYMY